MYLHTFAKVGSLGVHVARSRLGPQLQDFRIELWWSTKTSAFMKIILYRSDWRHTRTEVLLQCGGIRQAELRDSFGS